MTVLLGLVSVLVVTNLLTVAALVIIINDLGRQNDLLGTMFTQIANIISKMGK